LACEAPAKQARLALDNYEATAPLGAEILNPKSQILNGGGVVLALGPERGWGPVDRDQLRAAGFTLCSLGQRVLRLETAVIAALALVHHART
jgi:RsmE family RNA methyltransferase